MTYHTIRLRYCIILTLLSFYSNLLYGYVVEPSYSWDGSKLVTDEIEFVLPGNWDEPDVRIHSEDTSDILYKQIIMMRPISEWETEKVSILTISFGSTGRLDDFVERGVENLLDLPVEQEWYEYFITEHGYSAGVVSQQSQGAPSNSHITWMYVQGQIREASNLFEKTGVMIQISGINGLLNFNDVETFTDGLKFRNSFEGVSNVDSKLESIFSVKNKNGNWEESEWLGHCYTQTESNWIYHIVLGWLYVAASSDHVWLFSSNLNGSACWLWTTPNVFPFAYRLEASNPTDQNDGSWLYINNNEGVVYQWDKTGKKWEKLTNTHLIEEKTWEQKYEIWMQNPQPYGGVSGLQRIKDAKDSRATNLDFSYYTKISDISPLAGLTNLTSLDLENNKISDISPLAGLTNLTSLNLTGNYISDLTPLAGLTNLTQLMLSYNHNIIDLSPLAGLTNLTDLYLNGNPNNISDLTPLAGLTNLDLLMIRRNNISDLTPLAGLTNLTQLYLSWNKISDITPLLGLTNLMVLDVTSNNISESQKALLKETFPYGGQVSF